MAGFVVTVVVAAFFLGMGVYGLVAPAALVRPFGVLLDSATARSEVRAVYGGFGVAVAAALGYAAASDGSIANGIRLAVAIALAGMAFGRMVSALTGERTPFYPNWFYCLVEVAAAAALAAVA